MFTARIKNSSGQALTLTQNESEYQVIDIQGLQPAPATINITEYAGQDGGGINSTKVNVKNIVLTIKINGDVEKNRLMLYQILRPKEPCRFYYKNSSVDVYIDGYVETIECEYFSNGETMQVSILCPFPYFIGTKINNVDISKVRSEVEFPLAFDSPIPFSSYISDYVAQINNVADSDTGLTFTVKFKTASSFLTIINTATGEYITLNFNFIVGDKVIINTGLRQKSIKLFRNGTEYNLFARLDINSTLFQLHKGKNYISYDSSDSEFVEVKMTYQLNYRGV